MVLMDNQGTIDFRGFGRKVDSEEVTYKDDVFWRSFGGQPRNC
jgi:hypothetical protein